MYQHSADSKRELYIILLNKVIVNLQNQILQQ